MTATTTRLLKKLERQIAALERNNQNMAKAISTIKEELGNALASSEAVGTAGVRQTARSTPVDRTKEPKERAKVSEAKAPASANGEKPKRVRKSKERASAQAPAAKPVKSKSGKSSPKTKRERLAASA